MSVTVPTADVGVMTTPTRRHWLTVGALGVVMAAWPLVALGSAFEPEASVPQITVVRPPSVSAGGWTPSGLGAVETRVTGLGGAVVAVDAEGTWPVRLLLDGEWKRLLGMPLGVTVASGVGTAIDGGFVVAAVAGGRTVLFQYDTAGRFQGATTVFEIEAGVVAAVDANVVVFDLARPQAVVVGSDTIELPGVVVDVSGGSSLTVLTSDGRVHHSGDLGGSWMTLAEGYSALVGSDPVYAVGATPSVGLARIADDRTLERVESAPAGPTVSWGDRPAVYDWSSQSVWTLSGTHWERIPLWESRGFVGDFVSMIDGASLPSVVGNTERGPVIWQRRG